MGSRRGWVAGGLMLAALTALAAALWLPGFLAQDACLDAGGAWQDGACRR
ncbi:hypothetical protein [Methylobacterium oryzisoli]